HRERRVLRAVADRQTRDPRIAMRRSSRVRRRVAIDPEYAAAAARKVIHGGAAHRPEANHDAFIIFHLLRSRQGTWRPESSAAPGTCFHSTTGRLGRWC